MRTLVLTCILLLLPVVSADDYFLYDRLDLELLITDQMQVVPTSGSHYVDYVQANLSYYPEESYRQEVISLQTTPDVTLDETLNFRYVKPSVEFLFFEVDAELRTHADFVQVRDKIPFPVQGLTNDFYPYLEEEEIIDITPEIEQLAFQLAEGEDDLYQVVFNLADWTRQNIAYNLSTTTAEASQSASWVLENRYGVCDELTSLFIAMLRSLGIPAKFVSGISYTNVETFADPWGPHGWAEVYFPEVGWIPVDVTYGEIGWLDASHIKLKESTGPKKPSVSYEYKGRNIDLETTPLDFTTTVKNKGDLLEDVVSLSVTPFDDSIGFGSYNLIKVRVRNLKNYYVTEDVSLARTTRLQIVDAPLKSVVLAPHEEKTLYWIIKLTPDLDDNFIYTFPISAYTLRNTTALTEFKSRANQGIYTYEELKDIVDASADEQDPYARLVQLHCVADNTQIYYNDTVTVSCQLDNTGGSMLRFNTCFGETCTTVELPQGITKTLELTKRFETLGLHTIPVTAKGSGLIKTSYVVVNVLDEPALYISDLDAPDEVAFGESFDMVFTVTKRSQSFPQNINIYLEHDLIDQDWHYEELRTSHKFKLITSGTNLVPGKNQFVLTVHFEDEMGNQFSEQRDFAIALQEPTFTERIYIYMNRGGKKIDDFINDDEARHEVLTDARTWVSVAVVLLFIFAINSFFFIRRRLKGTEQHLYRD